VLGANVITAGRGPRR